VNRPGHDLLAGRHQRMARARPSRHRARIRGRRRLPAGLGRRVVRAVVGCPPGGISEQIVGVGELLEPGDTFYIKLDLPGTTLDAIELTVEQNVLTVHATRPGMNGEAELLVAERPAGTFTRQVFLGDARPGTSPESSARDSRRAPTPTLSGSGVTSGVSQAGPGAGVRLAGYCRRVAAILPSLLTLWSYNTASGLKAFTYLVDPDGGHRGHPVPGLRLRPAHLPGAAASAAAPLAARP
jgi:hypothetical protein